jgi:hypothetical protein
MQIRRFMPEAIGAGLPPGLGNEEKKEIPCSYF